MRFLFVGWFSATAERHYTAKLPCGKCEHFIRWGEATDEPCFRWSPGSRLRGDEAATAAQARGRSPHQVILHSIAITAFVRHTVRPDEQAVFHHHRH
jgi:hypothetical protein